MSLTHSVTRGSLFIDVNFHVTGRMSSFRYIFSKVFNYSILANLSYMRSIQYVIPDKCCKKSNIQEFWKKNPKETCTYMISFSHRYIFLSLDAVVVSCILVMFKESDVQNKQLFNIFLSLSYRAKNNTENDMNLNDGQTDWTLIASIVIPIIVVASFIVIVIILYIRKTSKLYRFTTKTSANTRYMCIFEWTTLIVSLLLNLSYEVYSEKHLWCNQDRNINLNLKSGIKRLRNVNHFFSFISI